MSFNEIDRHIISMDDFSLKWRFTDKDFDVLPTDHLKELKPLDKVASRFLFDFTKETALHDQIPFKKDFFKTIDSTHYTEENDSEIKKWLYHRALPFDKTVYLSWDRENSLKTKWKYVVKYWDCFYYGSSDDLTVFDESLEWALLFFHEDDIFWGTNKKFIPTNDIEFIWFSE